MKIKTHWLYLSIFLLILVVNGLLYWGFQHNYFFSDDFHWLGRAILAQDSPGEIFNIEGRDFNPVYLGLLGILIKIFGLSPLVLRLVSLFTFSAVIWMFFYILSRYFKVNIIIALSAALLSGFSVFISEVVLNLAALVYSLALLLFLAALKFYFDKKPWLYALFMLLAFFTKETIILAVLPLFFYEKEKNNRLFIAASAGVFVLLRVLLQMTAATSSYSSFLSTSNIFYKLYFILIRTMNLSPYTFPLVVGVLIIVLLFLISIYLIKTDRGLLFFLLLLATFSLFFSLLPKLSSRYFFYPTFGSWGIVALLTHYFYQKNKHLKYALVPLLLISVLLNYSLIKREIEDYKILGDFSRHFIQDNAEIIKNQLHTTPNSPEVIIFDQGTRQLAAVYQQVSKRKNLPKLLPPRSHSIGGVIEPKHLIPIIFYPDKIARWVHIEETPFYFKGKIEVGAKEKRNGN